MCYPDLATNKQKDNPKLNTAKLNTNFKHNKMTKYYLGIDETGKFDILKPEGSFVCGVLTQIPQRELNELYIKTYNEIKKTNLTTINEVLLKIHWTDMCVNRDVYQQSCWVKSHSPKIVKLYRSSGMPTLAANPQAFWEGAVATVIRNAIEELEFLRVVQKLNEPYNLEIFIDERARRCWGLGDEDNYNFIQYHRTLIDQIGQFIKEQLPQSTCKYEINFSNDGVNSFINFADICCGILRTKEHKNKVEDKVVICSCENNQITQLRKVHATLEDKEKENNQLKIDNSRLLLEKQRAEQLEQKAQEELKQKEKIQEENEKIQEEKNSLKNDLSKTETERAKLAEKLQKREAEQKNQEENQKQREEELQKQIEELLQRIEKVESVPQPLDVVTIPPSNSPFARRVVKMKPIDVEEKSMDDDQLDLIEKTINKSMLVSGCAGSGKSVIAMHKAQQILEMGGDVIVISYTKSLCEFMECGKTVSNLKERYYYHYQWKQRLMPQADYIIVDEIQDFTREEIQEFIKATRKNYFFFGDTAQSIYGGFKPTISIKEISEITGFQPLILYNNYRLPKSVAKITQQYIGIDVNPYSEIAYKSTETNLPHIVQIDTMEAQAKAIIEIVKKQRDKTIGVLVSDNVLVQKFMDIFYQENFLCEAKYNDGDSLNYTLDFSTQNPKLMTYHSAKGLQFGTVIIPMFDGATSNDRKKSLYVAMTRTYRDLFVLYSGELKTPLKEIDKSLYLSNF